MYPGQIYIMFNITVIKMGPVIFPIALMTKHHKYMAIFCNERN